MTKQIPLPFEKKVKLPYPCHYEKYNANIEGWSDNPGQLLISLPTIDETLTLSKHGTDILLNQCGLLPENIPGYKPKKRGYNLIEDVSEQDWEQFQRWKQTQKDMEEISDDNLYAWKELLRSVSSYCPDFDEDFDDLFEGLRKLPRMFRYVRTGSYPSMNLDDEDLDYYDETIYDPPIHRKSKGQEVAKVDIIEIGDGKL